jgi:hypothetical protein
MFCKQFDRETLKRELNTNDYRIITSTSHILKILVAWFMQLKLLSQFSLTRDILYDWTLLFFFSFLLQRSYSEHLTIRSRVRRDQIIEHDFISRRIFPHVIIKVFSHEPFFRRCYIEVRIYSFIHSIRDFT